MEVASSAAAAQPQRNQRKPRASVGRRAAAAPLPSGKNESLSAAIVPSSTAQQHSSNTTLSFQSEPTVLAFLRNVGLLTGDLGDAGLPESRTREPPVSSWRQVYELFRFGKIPDVAEDRRTASTISEHSLSSLNGTKEQNLERREIR